MNEVIGGDGTVLWSTNSYVGHEPHWDRIVNEANEFLKERIGVEERIDEVALMFGGQWASNEFINAAVMEAGVTHFNASTDSVVTSPIPSKYTVRYDFLQKIGSAYRVECMALLTGVSPLHSAFNVAAEDGPVTIHLSFKTANENAYHQACQQILRFGKLPLAQSCKSTYGRFSYWPMPLNDGGSIFLKPRVNTRDASLRIASSTIDSSLVTP